MKRYYSRIESIFYNIAMSNDPVTSSELAELLNVSQRTIINDMKEVNEFALSHGSEVISKRSVGYRLEIFDVKLFEKIIRTLSINESIVKRKADRSLYKWSVLILKKIMSIEGFFKIEDILSELYLTRSSVRKELKEIRIILSEFGLDMIVDTKKGSKIVGEEFSKRLLIVSLFEINYHEAVSIIESNINSDIFNYDIEQLGIIRQCVLSVLRSTMTQVSDENTQWISRYLLVSKIRFQQKFLLNTGSETEKRLLNNPKRKIAEFILNEIQRKTGICINQEPEITALQKLLLMLSDISVKLNLEDQLEDEKKLSFKLIKIIFKKIKEKYNLDFDLNKNSTKLLATTIIPQLYKNSFGFSNAEFSNSFVTNYNEVMNPLVTSLAIFSSRIIEENTQRKLSKSYIMFLATKFYILITQTKYQYIPRNILICSSAGIDTANHLRTEILNRFEKSKFNRFDSYELYEMRGIEETLYDAVIINIPEFAYKYSWPFVKVNLNLLPADFKEIKNKIIVKGFCFDKLLIEVFTEKNFQIYRNKSFELAMLSIINKYSKENYQKINEYIYDVIEYSLNQSIVFVNIPEGYVSVPFIEVFELKSGTEINGKRLDYLIIFSLKYKNSFELAKFSDQIFRLIINEPKLINLLFNKDFNKLLELVESIN